MSNLVNYDKHRLTVYKCVAPSVCYQQKRHHSRKNFDMHTFLNSVTCMIHAYVSARINLFLCFRYLTQIFVKTLDVFYICLQIF